MNGSMKFVVMLSCIAAATCARAQVSEGPLAGTHAGIMLDDDPSSSIYLKDAGFMPVVVVPGLKPDLVKLADKFTTGWSAGAMEVAAISLGIDVITVDDGQDADLPVNGRHGALTKDEFVVAAVGDVDWVALQFTVEETLPSKGVPPAIQDEENHERAIFAYVLPGSTLDAGIPGKVTRSLSGSEMGITKPIAGFNAHLALYLLDDPLLQSAGVPYGLPSGDVKVYFTLRNDAGSYSRGNIYTTTWDSGAAEWGSPVTFLTANQLDLDTLPGVVIDGLAVDAPPATGGEVSVTVEILFSTDSGAVGSELMYHAVGDPKPRIYAAKDDTGKVMTLDDLLGDVPIGDICDRDPGRIRGPGDPFPGTKPSLRNLDHYLIARRFRKGPAPLGISASGLRTTSSAGDPAMAALATWPLFSGAPPKTATLEHWLEEWEVSKKKWTRKGAISTQVLPILLGHRVGQIVPFPFAGPTGLGTRRRLATRWSLNYGGKTLRSPRVVLAY